MINLLFAGLLKNIQKLMISLLFQVYHVKFKYARKQVRFCEWRV